MLLKVKCEKCNTKYKLDEARIQGRGAKITCPRCRNVFVVMKSSVQGDDSLPGGRGDDDVADSATVSVSGTGVESQPSLAGASEPNRARDVATAPQASPSSAPRKTAPKKKNQPSLAGLLQHTGPLSQIIKRPSDADTLNWKEVGITTFKVKVAIGLVYDFSDVPTLKKYIAEKRVVSTDRVSFDGKVWTVLKDINNLDEFFIDQWVALKLERLLEEQGEAGALEQASPVASIVGSSPESESPILGNPPSMTPPRHSVQLHETTPSEPKQTPEKATPRAPAAKKAPSAPGGKPGASSRPRSGEKAERKELSGLLDQDLFGDIQVPEQGRSAEPVALPRNRPAQAESAASPGRKSGPSSSSAAAARARSAERKTRVFDSAIVIRLAAVAVYLGWKFYQEGVELKQTDYSQIDPRKEFGKLEQIIAKHFPVAYAAVESGRREAQPETPPPVSSPKPSPNPGDAARKQGNRSGANAQQSPGRRTPKKGTRRGSRDTDRDPAIKVANITAKDLYQVGRQALEMKNYPMAVQSLQSAAQMQPHNGLYQYWLGFASYRAGQYDEAIVAFNKALTLKNPQLESHKWLGEIYAKQGKKEEAIASYKAYLAGSPRDAEAIRKKLAKLTNS